MMIRQGPLYLDFLACMQQLWKSNATPASYGNRFTRRNCWAKHPFFNP